jgi:hypothetical protein
MEASTSHTDKEQRLELLAREYQRRGYEVFLHPTADDLPQALKGFAVGLIAIKGTEMVVADVRTRDQLTLNGNADVLKISERVELLGASLDLVVINPASQQGGRDENPSR